MKYFACTVLIVTCFLTVVEGEDSIIYINKDLITKTLGECVEFEAHHYYPLWSNSTLVWYKYSNVLKEDERITLKPGKKLGKKKLTIRDLNPDDTALYASEVVTKSLEGTQIREITRHWLAVADCKPHEKKLDFKDCKPACAAACPEDWLHSNGKCFKYFPEPKTWLDAYYQCQGHGGAKLATIENSEENSLVGNLIDTADGGWIGLNDQSEENRFVWNYNKDSRPEYTAWGDSEPNNFNGLCNEKNCVQMQVSNKKWNDVSCDAKFNYVCERKELVREWKCNDGKCYKYIENSLTWLEARKNCTDMGSTLARIESSSENKFVASLIDSNIWIGLNDWAEADVYVWNDIGMGQFSNKMTYTNWDSKEPNDKHYFTKSSCTGEDCVQIKKRKDIASWFDAHCNTRVPYICEKNRDPSLSFSAWIAISMGGCLVISIFAGRAYMSFRHRKGRSQVKQMVVDAITGEKKRKDSL